VHKHSQIHRPPPPKPIIISQSQPVLLLSDVERVPQTRTFSSSQLLPPSLPLPALPQRSSHHHHVVLPSVKSILNPAVPASTPPPPPPVPLSSSPHRTTIIHPQHAHASFPQFAPFTPRLGATPTGARELPGFKKRGRPTTRAGTNQCGECGTLKTPEWRRGENGMHLCNACGLQYNKRVRKEKAEKQKNAIAVVLNQHDDEWI